MQPTMGSFVLPWVAPLKWTSMMGEKKGVSDMLLGPLLTCFDLSLLLLKSYLMSRSSEYIE